MSKQRPILFSTQMVQAILEGRKTQTRRTKKLESINENPDNWTFFEFDGKFFNFQNNANPSIMVGIPCPYGKPGDILWVRESFSRHFIWGTEPLKDWTKTIREGKTCIFYKDGSIVGGCDKHQREERWKPSIHMPKAAARIWLEITNVRVERLHDISGEDAIAEGIERMPTASWWKNYMNSPLPGTSCQIESFKTLWESINGKESLDANPWVWVVEFKQIPKP